MKRFFMIVILMMILSGCLRSIETFEPVDEQSLMNEQSPEHVQEVIKVNLLAVGDNLIHAPIYNQASKRAGSEGFDFKPAYEHVVERIKGADLAFINQETPLGGTQLGLSAYPCFNSPQELGDDLIDMGFDIINHANNHILDKGEKGIKNTIEYWQNKSSVIMAGAYESIEDSENIRTIEKSGIRFSILSYTYGTNGIRLPESSKYFVPYISEDLIRKQVLQAKQISDVVIVSMHWGEENRMQPSAEQKSLAGLLADAGVDLVIGHHPHVIQPIEYVEGRDDKKALVVYSLGNFISSQNRAENMLGGMVEVEFEKRGNDTEVSISDMEFVPTITHYNGSYKNTVVYPFKEYSRDMAAEHGCIKHDSKFSYDYISSLITKTINEEMIK